MIKCKASLTLDPAKVTVVKDITAARPGGVSESSYIKVSLRDSRCISLMPSKRYSVNKDLTMKQILCKAIHSAQSAKLAH